MNATDILLVLLILLIFVLAVAKCVRDKKNGKSCSCGCMKCEGCGRK